MVTAQHILDLAERYARSQNISLITVSSRVFSDSKKLDAIKNSGADLTLKRAGTALEWFSDNWPDDCEWPKEIQRPALRAERDLSPRSPFQQPREVDA